MPSRTEWTLYLIVITVVAAASLRHVFSGENWASSGSGIRGSRMSLGHCGEYVCIAGRLQRPLVRFNASILWAYLNRQTAAARAFTWSFVGESVQNCVPKEVCLGLFIRFSHAHGSPRRVCISSCFRPSLKFPVVKGTTEASQECMKHLIFLGSSELFLVIISWVAFYSIALSSHCK